MASGPPRTAIDGSPYPDRAGPAFEREVQRMFASIAAGYEWFNHVSTFGQDYLWRPRALWALDRFGHRPFARTLDIGAGTGEFARAVARRYPAARVVATDFTGAMLAVARRRPDAPSLRARLDFGRANALALPFADGSFDLVTNAFVLRNLRDLSAGLGEMRRVLRPGGMLLALDITEPTDALVGRLFHAYFDRVVPMMGRAIGAEGPRRYLAESLKSLPPRPAIDAMLHRAGFGRTRSVAQSSGIVTSFLGEAGETPQSR
ncbi:MAG TPA: ubiquinone/menaquinone biosynthesis methyltransferase [Thermoplasmata archaeon]|nr:ubiquinone/menaquinone biosynthesis methyltransferase [Thermoplasmata archaeon]